jgi:imidazolonepropionase-like amidohydrolase
MKRLLFFIAFIMCVMSSSFGQKTLLINGYLHVGNGDVMPTAAIGIIDGKIVSIKNAMTTRYEPSDWDTIIDVEGQHVYPGFVAPNSTLGLTEIDAVRATRDFQDVGEFNPHVRTQIAYNVESNVIETVLTNGVLFAQATPRGGIISGTSSVMFLAGWNWEDATILKDDGIHVNWPPATSGGGWWAEPAPKSINKDYANQKATIEGFFEMSFAYANNKEDDFDQRLEAMIGCFKGKKRVFFHADELQQLLDVIEFCEKYAIKYPVIIGGHDAYLLGARLKDSHIPIMLERVHKLPEFEDEPVDLPYQLPNLLQKQGVLFCLQNQGDMEAMNARNLPFQAGTAMAYGLTEEQAIQAISLSTCQILGIDEKYGSIEIGKSATLFVSQGNALDMRTNKVNLIMRDGKLIENTNFQEDLYLKYKKKYQKN